MDLSMAWGVEEALKLEKVKDSDLLEWLARVETNAKAEEDQNVLKAIVAWRLKQQLSPSLEI